MKKRFIDPSIEQIQIQSDIITTSDITSDIEIDPQNPTGPGTPIVQG